MENSKGTKQTEHRDKNQEPNPKWNQETNRIEYFFIISHK